MFPTWSLPRGIKDLTRTRNLLGGGGVVGQQGDQQQQQEELLEGAGEERLEGPMDRGMAQGGGKDQVMILMALQVE